MIRMFASIMDFELGQSLALTQAEDLAREPDKPLTKWTRAVPALSTEGRCVMHVRKLHYCREGEHERMQGAASGHSEREVLKLFTFIAIATQSGADAIACITLHSSEVDFPVGGCRYFAQKS